MRLKVLYDISQLGYGFSDPQRYRTGICRVVEHVAFQLASSEECELTFSGAECLQHCQDYLKASSELKRVPLPYPPSFKFIKRTINRLNAALNEERTLRRVPLRGTRKLLTLADGVIKATQCQIDPKSLSQTEIFHSPFHPFPEQVKQVKNIQKFLTIYDLIPVFYPELFESGTPQLIDHVLQNVKAGAWVVTISESTKNDLCNHLKIDPARVFVAYPAADDTLFYPCTDASKIEGVRRKYNIPSRPYILSLSTLEPRKRMDHVIRCFARMVQEHKDTELCLVLAGGKGWKYEQIFNEISDVELLRGRIIVTGFVADEDLSPLYSGASFFVYPSLYEGFGLPPLEAMQCGTPVITSNTSSLPEVVGDAGITVDPHDEDELSHRMFDLYDDFSLRDLLARKSLEMAKKFSWGNCAQETIRAYSAALNK